MAGRGCCSRCSTAPAAAAPSPTAGAATDVLRRPRPVPGLQGLQGRLPGQRRHGHLQGRVPLPPLREAPAAARALLHGLAAALGGARRRTPRGWSTRCSPRRASARSRSAAAGIDEHRVAPAFARADASRTGSPAASPAARASAARSCCGPTRSPTTSTPRSRRRPSRCWRTPAGASIVPVRAGLLRADLDLHRAARHRQARPAAHAGRAAAAPARRHPRPRPGAQLHGGVPCRRHGAVPRRRGRGEAPAADRHPRRAAARPHARAGAPPRLDRTVHVQTHCHHHAIMGYAADRQLLDRRSASQVDVLDSGCCGLAGNFGFEKGHYEVSEACAERVLLPAVRAADDADVILADGFSCRTQIEQGDIRWPRRRPPRRAAARRTARRRRRGTARAAVGAAAGTAVAYRPERGDGCRGCTGRLRRGRGRHGRVCADATWPVAMTAEASARAADRHPSARMWSASA